MTQRRCTEKFPPQISIIRKDSIVTKDTVIYRDRIVHDTIPADTMNESKPLPPTTDPKIKELKSSVVHLENDYATAKAWIEGWQLILELIQKGQVIDRILKDAEKETRHWRELYESEIKKEIVNIKYIPLFVKILAWIGASVIIGVVVYIVLKLKL